MIEILLLVGFFFTGIFGLIYASYKLEESAAKRKADADNRHD